MAKLAYADIIERDQRYRALAELGLRLDLATLPQLMPRLVELVAPEHLPLLAESRSILGEDGYWLAESDAKRRSLIKGAYELHRYKGTPWSIREIIRRFGFGEVDLIEGTGQIGYDGKHTYNGLFVHGDVEAWAVYRVILQQPITNDQAALLRQTLAAFAPARCHLAALDYTQAPITYNGAATYNGNYNHGAS